MYEEEYIRSVFEYEVGKCDNIQENKSDTSSNDCYIVEHQNNKYFIKITDEDFSEIKLATIVQNLCNNINIAPKNVFIKDKGDNIIKCNEYIESYEPTIFYQRDRKERNDICSIMSDLADSLHSIERSQIIESGYSEEKISKKCSFNLDNHINDKISKLDNNQLIDDDCSQTAISKLEKYMMDSHSDGVLHLTDYTTTNIIFNKNYSDGYIIDWEVLSFVPLAYAITGIWYRLVRTPYIKDSEEEHIWKIISNNYGKDIPDYNSDRRKFWTLMTTIHEINGFNKWNRWKDSDEVDEQKNELIDRINRT